MKEETMRNLMELQLEKTKASRELEVLRSKSPIDPSLEKSASLELDTALAYERYRRADDRLYCAIKQAFEED